MTQEHTPEPWIIRRGDWSTHATLITTAKRRRNKTVPIAEVDTDGFNKEFGDEQKANARRIVACVNACAGVSNGELAMTTMSAVLARMNEAEQQRDELLAALVNAKESLERCYDVTDWPCNGSTDQDKAIAMASAAITKTTGETK